MNFKDLFKDDPNIKPLIVNDDLEALKYSNSFFDSIIRTGIFSNNQIQNDDFCKQFYQEAKVDYSKRWSSFLYTRDLEKENKLYNDLVKEEGYIFLHQDIKRGLIVKRDFSNIIQPKHSLGDVSEYTIFNYLQILESSKEIHCIDSSFACFIDHIPSLKEKPKFIHRYTRKNNNNPHYKNDWIILDE